MNGLVSKGVWNHESAAVDCRAGRRSYDGCHMTRRAADPGEDRLPSLRIVSRGERLMAGWHFRAADELGKMIDVVKAEVVRNILRISCNFAHRRGVFRAQPVRDAHFVQISVADEREQAAVLVFPSKASDARLPGRLQDRNALLGDGAVSPLRAPLFPVVQRGF
jgi:hypothetical protein